VQDNAWRLPQMWQRLIGHLYTYGCVKISFGVDGLELFYHMFLDCLEAQLQRRGREWNKK